MQRQWYYVNQPVCDSYGGRFFNGSHVPLSTMFYHPSSSTEGIGLAAAAEPFLYYANTLAQLSTTFAGSGIDLADPSSDPKAVPAIKEKLKRLLSYSDTKEYRILQERMYDLYTIVNYENEFSSVRQALYGLHPSPVEVGLFDHSQGEYVTKETRTHSTGSLLAMRLEERSAATCIEHRVLLNIDRRAFVTLSGHLHGPCIELDVSVDGQNQVTGDDGQSKVTGDDGVRASSLSIVTYNIWHNNPPGWIYHDPDERWDRYEHRMQHRLREALGHSDRAPPDVLLLQEVRLDAQFRRPGDPLDGGSQLEHILRLLSVLLQERGDWSYSYQSVYQPMMQLVGRDSLCSSRVRNEEGVLLLVRSDIEVVEVSSWLLPRYLNDSRDDHQRGALGATLRRDGLLYDVSTTHLSLLEQSRGLSVRSLIDILDSRLPLDSAISLQLLAGDMNAEPHEDSVSAISSSSSLTDTWTVHGGAAAGLTFPTDDPVKRIDYVFARGGGGGGAVSSIKVDLLGALPTEDSMHLLSPVEQRPPYGMLSAASPLFASDHLGLRVDMYF